MIFLNIDSIYFEVFDNGGSCLIDTIFDSNYYININLNSKIMVANKAAKLYIRANNADTIVDIDHLKKDKLNLEFTNTLYSEIEPIRYGMKFERLIVR